jgi:hypothetical protein
MDGSSTLQPYWFSCTALIKSRTGLVVDMREFPNTEAREADSSLARKESFVAWQNFHGLLLLGA